MGRIGQLHHDTAPERAEDAEREVARLTEENARLRTLLADLEWRGTPGDTFHCPACKSISFDGHAPDCRLKAELG